MNSRSRADADGIASTSEAAAAAAAAVAEAAPIEPLARELPAPTYMPLLVLLLLLPLLEAAATWPSDAVPAAVSMAVARI